MKTAKLVLILIAVSAASASIAQAREKILWNQLVKGSGDNKLQAIGQLARLSDSKEQEWMDQCEKVGGVSTWSDITFTKSETKGAKLHAYQDFLCMERKRAENTEMASSDAAPSEETLLYGTQISDSIRGNKKGGSENVAAAENGAPELQIKNLP